MSPINQRDMPAAKFSTNFGAKLAVPPIGMARLGIGSARTSPAVPAARFSRQSGGPAGSAPARVGHGGLSGHMFVVLTRCTDLALLALSGVAATQICNALDIASTAGETILATVAASLAALFVLNQMDAYAPSRLRNPTHRVKTICIALAVGYATAIVCFTLMPIAGESLRWWPLMWLGTAGVTLCFAALLTAQAARALSNAEKLATRVAVVGVSDYSLAMIDSISADPDRAATFVGLYHDGSDQFAPGGELPVLGSIGDLVLHSRRDRIDAIVLALPLSDEQRLKRSRAALRSVTADIYLAGELLEYACKTSKLDRVGPVAVIKIGSRPLTEWESLEKSAFDWCVSAILLVAALPFLCLIALAIRLDSPGPVLFRQPRLGFNNNMFNVFKFRTMYHHMTDMTADRQTTRDDARVTRVGRILRKTSLDEIPQLLNVLRGEMSLVGPRPHAPTTKAGHQLFHVAVADYALRHRVKPGITGWAQVNGWRGETRTLEQIEQRVAHDLYYIDNWSFLLDIKIMILTALRELNSKAAY